MYDSANFPGKRTGVGCCFLSRGSPRSGDQTQVSRIEGRRFTHCTTREAQRLSNFVLFIRWALLHFPWLERYIQINCVCYLGYHGLPRWPSGKESNWQCRHVREMGSIPGLGRSPGVGNGKPLQYSCLGNPLDKKPGGLQPRALQRVTQWSTRTMAEWQGAISFTFFMAQNIVHLGECSVSLRGMCNLLWLGEVVYEWQLNSVDWWGCSVQLCPYWYFLPAGFVADRGVSKSLAIIVDLSVSLCSSINFCLMYFVALLLGVCTVRIVISSWKIGLFIFL